MKGRRNVRCTSNIDKEGEDADTANQLKGEVAPGELIWVKLHGSSWWPAQVFDENSVSGGSKHGDRSVGEVLVRLYGSYEYMSVDPAKCHSEFENMLKQHNGSFSKIFKLSLEQDLSYLKSGKSTGKGSRSKVNVRVDASQDKRSKQNVSKKLRKIECPNSKSDAFGKHAASSVQRTRLPKTDLGARSSVDNASNNVGSKLHGSKKNLGNNARVSQMRSAAKTSQATKKEHSFSRETHKVMSRKRKLEEMQREQSKNSPNFVRRISPRRRSAATTFPTMLKDGNSLSEGTVKAKGKKQIKDEIIKARISSKRLSRSTGDVVDKQGEVIVQKKLKRSSLSPSRIHTRMHSTTYKSQTMLEDANLLPDKPQAKFKDESKLSKKTDDGARNKAVNGSGLRLKLTPIKPSDATTPVGKSQELSARRMKVMKSLGLVAPSGSPFHLSEHIFPNPVSL